MALVAAVCFFASILLHELGHARRAQREGVPIEGVTLWLFGGVARMRGTPPSPGAAFRVAAMWPAVTAVLALGRRLRRPDQPARPRLQPSCPRYPLDGGRILQSWTSHRTRSFSASTVQAATVGQVFGYLLVAVGLLGLFSGAGIGGICMAFIGWFLVLAGRRGRPRPSAPLARASAGTATP